MNRPGGRIGAAVVAALAVACAHAPAAEPPLPQVPQAADLSLEELLRTEVVTVSRKPQSLQSTAAAAFVITRDDIERSGATSIPDALRLAPGVQVAHIANNRWAVSVRGFNGRFANKLLVLMDGRSIYSPLFSGVIWEYEDTLLEDIERIEVIRGPGAALWGANAVNGVINIITRKARDTQGSLAVLAAGTETRGSGAFRQGLAAGDGHLRLWAKAFSREESETAAGERGNDHWRALRAGFRGDWPLAAGNRLTLSGGAFTSATPDRWNLPDVAAPSGASAADVAQNGSGFHLLARHEWALPDASEAVLQATLDHQNIDVRGYVHQLRNTLDVDFQRRLRAREGHDIVWGLGWRYSPDRIDSSGIVTLAPQQRSFNLASAYVQDEIELRPQLRLTLGLRLEHNSITGFEPQPNARLAWTPTPTPSQTLWAALARAVHTPSRADRDASVDLFVVPAAPPVPAVLTRTVVPSPDGLDAERVQTVEFGWRRQIDPRLSVDLTAFYSDYTGLRSARSVGTQVLLTPAFLPYVLQTLQTDNGVDARSRGVELALDWLAAPWWRLQPNVSFIEVRGRPADADPAHAVDAAGYAGSTPRWQGSLRSAMTFARGQQVDLWLRHVERIGGNALGGAAIPAYTTLDARWAWRVGPGLELSLVGQNLLQHRHAEAVAELLPSQPLLVERSAYVKARWQF